MKSRRKHRLRRNGLDVVDRVGEIGAVEMPGDAIFVALAEDEAARLMIEIAEAEHAPKPRMNLQQRELMRKREFGERLFGRRAQQQDALAYAPQRLRANRHAQGRRNVV